MSGKTTYWRFSQNDTCRFCYPEKRKARKEHKCLECNGIIPVGAEYWHFAGRWNDGSKDEFSTWNICQVCDEDWQKLINILRENGEREAGIVYGEICEAIGEAVDLGYLPEEHSLAQKWLTNAKNITELSAL